MPCDGKNDNCERRRKLLHELKCLITSMDQTKPCEWEQLASPPPIRCPTGPSSQNPPSRCIAVKDTKSINLRAGIIYKCECIKRNGLQDRCMMNGCMGRPECMTKLYPVCTPGRAALLNLTDQGDAKTALDKFHAADQAREAALATYCRLACPQTQNDGTECLPPLFIPPPSSTPNGPRVQPLDPRMFEPRGQNYMSSAPSKLNYSQPAGHQYLPGYRPTSYGCHPSMQAQQVQICTPPVEYSRPSAYQEQGYPPNPGFHYQNSINQPMYQQQYQYQPTQQLSYM